MHLKLHITPLPPTDYCLGVSGGANIDVNWRIKIRHVGEAPPGARLATGGVG